MTRKGVHLRLPGTEAIVVHQRLSYGNAGQTFQLYSPPHSTKSASLPAVILVSGLSDIGAQRIMGCRISEMESFISWAQLLAASGMIAVTYTTDADPVLDLRAVIDHLNALCETFGIDANRLGLWACSSHVPNAVGLMIDRSDLIACAALCYGFMLDLDGSTGVAEAQRQWRFVNPASGKRVTDIPAVPLLLVRAGKDANPEINPSIDAFTAHALRHNLPITVVNHHVGGHAFDVEDSSDQSKQIVEQILQFFRIKLLSPSPAHSGPSGGSFLSRRHAE